MSIYKVNGYRTRKIHIDFIQSNRAVACNVNKKLGEWHDLRVFQNLDMQRIVYNETGDRCFTIERSPAYKGIDFCFQGLEE